MSFQYFDIDEKNNKVIIGETNGIGCPAFNIKKVSIKEGFDLFLEKNTDRKIKNQKVDNTNEVR